jgi:hypothetical protein
MTSFLLEIWSTDSHFTRARATLALPRQMFCVTPDLEWSTVSGDFKLARQCIRVISWRKKSCAGPQARSCLHATWRVYNNPLAVAIIQSQSDKTCPTPSSMRGSSCYPLVCPLLHLLDERPPHTPSDGGGIRGLSELLILREIMHRIKDQDKLTELPLPCEYFDMIGGTSTGG